MARSSIYLTTLFAVDFQMSQDITFRQSLRRNKRPPGPAMLSCRCPIWVKSRHSVMFDACPLYPPKRTFIAAIGMSALGQYARASKKPRQAWHPLPAFQAHPARGLTGGQRFFPVRQVRILGTFSPPLGGRGDRPHGYKPVGLTRFVSTFMGAVSFLRIVAPCLTKYLLSWRAAGEGLSLL
jgi:hypothetical protein